MNWPDFFHGDSASWKVKIDTIILGKVWSDAVCLLNCIILKKDSTFLRSEIFATRNFRGIYFCDGNLKKLRLLGDFNLDQMLQENVNRMHPITERFNLHQRSHYSTHVQGSILDLVYDTKITESVSWIPSAYSDHFTLCIDI